MKCLLGSGHGELLEVVEGEGAAVVDELDGVELVGALGACDGDEDVLGLEVGVDDALVGDDVDGVGELEEEVLEFCGVLPEGVVEGLVVDLGGE